MGAILGAAAAIFLAPKSGQEMREDVKRIASDLTKKIAKEVEDAKDLTKESYDKIVDTVVAEYNKDKKMTEEVFNEIKKELKAKWLEVKAEFEKE